MGQNGKKKTDAILRGMRIEGQFQRKAQPQHRHVQGVKRLKWKNLIAQPKQDFGAQSMTMLNKQGLP